MNRIQSLAISAVILLATCVWFTASRAEDQASDPDSGRQVEQLVSRIEKLEKRIKLLEDKELATRQVNAVNSPFIPQALPVDPEPGRIVPPPDAEPARPKPRFMLLQHVERR